MSDLSEPMIFEDEGTVEVPVTIKGKKYLLKPLNAGSVAIYKNKSTSNVILDEAGKIKGIGNAGDMDPLAVHLALHYDDLCFATENGKRVPQAVVNLLPGKVVEDLAKRAIEISDMKEEAIAETVETLEKKLAEAKEREAKLKNESAPSTEQSE